MMYMMYENIVLNNFNKMRTVFRKKKMTTYLHGCRFWIISTAIPLASLSIKLIDPNTNAQLVYTENKINKNHTLFFSTNKDVAFFVR